MTENDMILLTNSMERNIAPDKKDRFNNVIHVIPIWRLNVTATVEYMINIDAPVAKWKMHYKTVTPTNTNHGLP